MAQSDSSVVDEERNISKDERKEKTKKPKKKAHRRDADGAADDDGSINDNKRTDTDSDENDHHRKNKHEKKNKKSKKKKEKKRKHSVDSRQDSSSDSDGVKHSKKKQKKSSKHKKDKVESTNQTKKLILKETDEKIVSSSAIEFYPEDLKDLQLKKNQEAALETAASYLPKKTKKSKTKALAEKKAYDNTKSPTGDNDCDDSNKESKLSSAKKVDKINNVTLLLFYQYVEPPWDETQFKTAFKFVNDQGNLHKLTGRMRVAREGLNCTLTGSYDGIRGWCAAMRKFDGGRPKIDPETGEKHTEFAKTEFKLTDDLPPKQRFPKLHPFEVVELVNYGLAGSRAPEISKHGGTHLEPEDYHKKMCETDTVIIDVRNHYEANIGRFDPPKGGAKMIDPMMRKSTEFPIWLDKPETKEMLRGKQVLMYCTGGVRCERASALLKQKIDTEVDTKSLGIKGVFQLQGGVDKYFKNFPEGGLWKGKNYTFDKRFAHAPPAVEALDRTKKVLCGGNDENCAAELSKIEEDAKSLAIPTIAAEEIMGKCEACYKPWDMYRGKRRCPTCGVPSLICRECMEADRDGTHKIGKDVRCDLCVAEHIRHKSELREKEEKEMKEYEQKLRKKLDIEYEPPIQRKHAITRKPKPNPERITRLFLKNMCAKQMDEAKLLEFVHPSKVTHIQWLTDRNTGMFYGSAFIEVKTAEDAGSVLALDGMMVLGRRIKIKYQRADDKDNWPIPNTEVEGY